MNMVDSFKEQGHCLRWKYQQIEYLMFNQGSRRKGFQCNQIPDNQKEQHSGLSAANSLINYVHACSYFHYIVIVLFAWPEFCIYVLFLSVSFCSHFKNTKIIKIYAKVKCYLLTTISLQFPGVQFTELQDLWLQHLPVHWLQPRQHMPLQ